MATTHTHQPPMMYVAHTHSAAALHLQIRTNHHAIAISSWLTPFVEIQCNASHSPASAQRRIISRCNRCFLYITVKSAFLLRPRAITDYGCCPKRCPHIYVWIYAQAKCHLYGTSAYHRNAYKYARPFALIADQVNRHHIGEWIMRDRFPLGDHLAVGLIRMHL